MIFGRDPSASSKEQAVSDQISDSGEQKTGAESGKPDLLEYLAGLDDPPSPLDSENESNNESPSLEAPSEPEEKTKEELLAESIRQQSKASQVISYTALKAGDADVDSVMKALFEDDRFADVLSLTGQKDTYYYSDKHMTTNYATIAVLVEEKDLPHTVAEMVRFNCKTYPSPTPVSYFMNHPYCFTGPQIERVRDTLKKDSRYQDILEVVTGNNKIYFYSLPVMSERYALSLAESAEHDEYGYR